MITRKSINYSIFFILALLSSQYTYSFDDKIIQALQKSMDQQTSQKRTPGIVVGIIEGNQRKFLYSGYSDFENQIPLTGKEFFSIGSVSKTFTSLLLSHAVINNKVSIDEKVKNLLPEFSNSPVGSITLRQLSTHSSGLPRTPHSTLDIIELNDKPFENYSRKQLKEDLYRVTKLETINQFNYSNLAIALLAYCLEQIYKQDFETALRENILSPLNIDQMYVKIKNHETYVMARKHSASLETISPWQDIGIMNGVGNIKSSISLMLDYLQAQLTPQHTKLSREIMNSQKVLKDYSKIGLRLAYGWIKTQNNLYFHSGSTAGFSTEMLFSSEQNKGIVTFTNSETKLPCLISIFFKGSTECQTPKLIYDSIETLEKIEGIYLSNIEEPSLINNFHTFQQIEISKSLYGYPTIYIKGQPRALRLFKVADNKYEFYGGAGKIFFQLGEDRTVEYLRIEQGGEIIKANKMN